MVYFSFFFFVTLAFCVEVKMYDFMRKEIYDTNNNYFYAQNKKNERKEQIKLNNGLGFDGGVAFPFFFYPFILSLVLFSVAQLFILGVDALKAEKL